MSVTFNKLSDRVHGKLQNIPAQEIHEILRVAFIEIGDALASGEDVFLEGFGRFYPDYKPSRVINSGLTKSKHTVRKKAGVKFNAFDKLNKRVQVYLQTLGLNITEESDDSKHTASPLAS